MKELILVLYLCSGIANTCMPPYQWPERFDDSYSCMVQGYEEAASKTKEIGSSLEADIEIYLGEEYLELVKDINLSEYFITSKAIVKNMMVDDKIFKLNDIPNVGVIVRKAKGEKCSRCWKILGNPCQRCSGVLKN